MPCDRYDVEVSLINSSPDLLAYYKEHEDIIKYVGKYSGFTMSSDDVFESFYHIDSVHDVLFIEVSVRHFHVCFYFSIMLQLVVQCSRGDLSQGLSLLNYQYR